jgi:lipoprotein signal peptidase
MVATAISRVLLDRLDALPGPLVVALSRIGGAAGFTSLWWIVAPGRWKATLMLFSAAALGNLIGLIVPPHEIIDFIYSRPLSLVFRQGVVNLADLYYDAGLLCLGATVLRWLASQARRRLTLH